MSKQPTPTPELLTDLEKEIIDLAGALWALINEAIPDGPARAGDLRELLPHIHAIQVYFKSNAAGRAYPDQYRVLGGFLPESTVEEYKKIVDPITRVVQLSEEEVAGYVWPLHSKEHALLNLKAGKEVFNQEGARIVREPVIEREPVIPKEVLPNRPIPVVPNPPPSPSPHG